MMISCFSKNRWKIASKKGWHTEPSLSQPDGRTKPRYHLLKSPFFAVFCPLLRENVGIQASNRAQLLFLLQNSFRVKMFYIFQKKQNESRPTATWPVHGRYGGKRGVFSFSAGIGSLVEKMQQTADTAGVSDQCNNAVLYILTMLQTYILVLSPIRVTISVTPADGV